MDWDKKGYGVGREQRKSMVLGMVFIAFACLALTASNASAGPEEQASRLFARIAGVPLQLNDPRRPQIVALIQQGNYMAAAAIAADDDNFFNVTLKHWAMTMSNRDEDPFAQTSDFVAIVIGSVRDNKDARELLSGDFTYQADPAQVAGLPAIDPTNNNHYAFLDQKFVNLRQTLVRIEPQRADIPDAAGLLTSRGWGAAHLSAGTNRRPIEFAFQEFACVPLKQMVDTSLPDYHVRRDVDRSPGGNAATYQSSCRDCHAGMDALGGVYSHFDFSNQVEYSTGIASKMNKNGNVYPAGYVTTNDAWVNAWTKNQNVGLGWRGALAGNGVKQFGAMLANSEAFSRCMAYRVFAQACRRPPADGEDGVIRELAGRFEANGYSLKYLFEAAAASHSCLGD